MRALVEVSLFVTVLEWKDSLPFNRAAEKWLVLQQFYNEGCGSSIMGGEILALIGSLFFSLKRKWFVILYSLRPACFCWNMLVSKLKD